MPALACAGGIRNQEIKHSRIIASLDNAPLLCYHGVMLVTFWGTRGSIPVPGPSTIRYGGNTPCVSVRLASGPLLVLDAGTGIRALGNAPEMSTECSFALLLSHGHWDHIQGFPFFAPGYRDTCRIQVFGGPGGTNCLKQLLSDQMEHSYFPVQFEQLQAQVEFDEIYDDWKQIGSARVRAFPLRHTGVGWGFRIEEGPESGGGVIVYLTDNELTPGSPDWDFYRDICRGADLLIHDAQYLDHEMPLREGWGHSSGRDATSLAIEAGCKRLALFHHDPDRSDAAIDELTADCRAQAILTCSKLEIFAAAEAQSFEISGAIQEPSKTP